MESCRAVGAVSQAGEETRVGSREKDERYAPTTTRGEEGGGRGGGTDGKGQGGGESARESGEARVRRPSVIKARQELRRDERTAAPEDTARDLCDSDIQPASIAEPQKRFSAYRLVTSRPPTDIARPISKHHCGVEIGEIYVPTFETFLRAEGSLAALFEQIERTVFKNRLDDFIL